MVTPPTIPEAERKRAPLERSLTTVLTPFQSFIKNQSTSGLLLCFAALLALVLANSPYRTFYESLNALEFGIFLGNHHLSFSLNQWVNDGLMVIFFFLLGLEIKRECLVGDLNQPRYAGFIVVIALGGILLPAMIYSSLILFCDYPQAMRGWGIPLATDTAFALGILALLGHRVPAKLAAVLSAYSIVDDIGAILVITLFYTESVNWVMLYLALFSVLLLYGFNLIGFRKPFWYFLVGVLLWRFMAESGMHATTAGILAAFAVPTKPYAKKSWFIRQMRKIVNRFEAINAREQTIFAEDEQHRLTEQAIAVAEKTHTPLQHWSSVLEKPVMRLILPLFAFLNAGIALPHSHITSLGSPIIISIVLALFIGKSVGVSSFAAIYIHKSRFQLPSEVTFKHLVGMSFLSGIGFTMSLFIAALAFSDAPQYLLQAKVGILLGSLLSAMVSIVLLVKAHTVVLAECSPGGSQF